MMLSVSDAIKKLTDSSSLLVGSEKLEVTKALGRVLGEDIIAQIDVPPANNSAMDGYAFCYKDAVNENFILPLSQKISAGQHSKPLNKSTAVRIFTGAELPAGADTVALQEYCSEKYGLLVIDKQVMLHNNVRYRGQDLKKGKVVLNQGITLRAQELALLASLGMEKVIVFKKLRVGFFTTGDELIQPGIKRTKGKTYDSNKPLISTLITSMGMVPIDVGVAKDNLNETLEALSKAAEMADVVVSAGGVSVGESDFLKKAVEFLGEIFFWKVAIKPGKPMVFGQINGVPYIGLPGNTASVFVGFLILLRPFLLKSQGCNEIIPVRYKVPALFSRHSEQREVYIRARLEVKGVEVFNNQSSGVLSSACWGNAFAIQPPNVEILYGDMIDVITFNNLSLNLI